MQRLNYLATFVFLMVLSVVVRAGEYMDYQEKVHRAPSVLSCRLSVASDRLAYQVSQSVRLHVWLENRGADAVHILKANVLEVYRFQVLLPTGVSARLTPEGERQKEAFETFLLELQPGESDRVIVAISDLYDVTVLGESTIRIYRGILPSGANATWTEIPANELKIEIHDRVITDSEAIFDKLFRAVSDQKPSASDADTIKLDERGHVIQM